MKLNATEVQAALYALNNLLTRRTLNGERVPESVQRLRDRIELVITTGDPDDEPDSDPTEITTAEAAAILGYTERYVRMIAPSLDGRRLGRDWTFPKAAVIEYAQSRTVA